MFVKFSDKAQKALVIAESLAYQSGQTEVTSQHLLVALLKMPDVGLNKLLKQYKITEQTILERLKLQECEQMPAYLEYSDELRYVIECSMAKASSKKVSVELLSYVLVDKSVYAKQILEDFDVNIDLLKQNLKEKKDQILLQFSELIDLNEKVKTKGIQVIGRDKELTLLMEMLCRKEKNNAIIVGDAGVGKTALVEKLAATLNNLPSSHPLYQKRVYELDLAGVLAGTKYRGDFEEKLKKIIYSLKDDKNAIVFIDEIHNLVDAGKAEGAIDASNILKPYLARGEISCIGATTYQEYKKYFESDPALNRRFSKIDLKEENQEAIFNILKGLKNSYETFHCVSICDDILKEIIEMTTKYMRDRQQPDKSLDVLDLCCVKAKMDYNHVVTKECVEIVVAELCGYDFKNQYTFKQMANNVQTNEESLRQFYEDLKKDKRVYLFYGNVSSKLIQQIAQNLNKHLVIIEFGMTKEYFDSQFLEEIKRYSQSIVYIEDFNHFHMQLKYLLKKVIDQKEYQGVDFSHVIFIFKQKIEKNVSGFMKDEKVNFYDQYIEEVIPF